MKPVRIYTVVWGEQHLDWFATMAMPSLFWCDNGHALKGAKWSIYTDRNTSLKLGAVLEQQRVIPMEDVSIEILNNPDLLWCIRHVINKCVDERSRMLMAPPDTIFGPTAIRALMQLSERNECVAVPHFRVLPGIIHGLEPGFRPESNANLVSLALRHAHPSWTESELGKKPSASFFGGVLWQWVQPDLIAVQHRLPTVYMANFNDFDRKYFEKKASHFLFWDTYWPHDLVYQERFRVVGSSDVAFMCELTEPDKNMPKLTDINPEPDAYHMMGNDHNLVCRQFMAVFREG